MEIKYELKDNIGVLVTPTEITLPRDEKICFTFFEKSGIMELNKVLKYKIQDGKCYISPKSLQLGTNTIRVLGERTTSCQPINVHDIADKLQCTLATSLDTLVLINRLQDKCVELDNRLNEIEKTNPSEMLDRINALISITNDMQVRLNELEVGYDPTLI